LFIANPKRNTTYEKRLVSSEAENHIYPGKVLKGVMKSLKEAEENQLMPYKGIKEMLELPN